MTKIYMSLLLMLFSFAADAQIHKGATLLGGNVSFYSRTTDVGGGEKQKNTNGTFKLSLGKAVKENTVVGVNIGYSPIKYTNRVLQGTDLGDIVINQYEVGAFYRKFRKLGGSFYLFGQLDAGVAFGSEKWNFYAVPKEEKGRNVGGYVSFMPGLSYQLTKRTLLELSMPNLVALQYSTSRENMGSMGQERKSETLSFYSSLTNVASLGSLSLGFRFLL